MIRVEPPDIRKVWDFDQPAESRQRFQALKARFAGDEHAFFRLELDTQIARSHGLAGEFDQAHAVLDSVETALAGAPPIVRLRYLLERGRAFNSSGRAEDAAPLFLEAWQLGREAGEHGLAVDAAHMMAIVEKNPASLEWNERAIAHAEETQDPKALDWLGSLYNNSGWSHHDMGNFARALELWEKALAWHGERNPGSDRERIARYMVGRGMRSLERFDDALAVQSALLSDIETQGLEQDGYVYEEIAECLLALNRSAEAAIAFGQAYDLLAKDEWLAANEQERLERMKSLAGR